MDLADYGLDDPWGYYKIVTPDGEVQELSFGDFTDDTDYYCYFYDHTTEQIYYTSYASLSFLMTDPMDVTAAYVLSANLSDIEYITSCLLYTSIMYLLQCPMMKFWAFWGLTVLERQLL